MTMIVNQPMESYTLALGFFLNNRIWDLMVMTGVAYIPIITLIISAVANAYQGGDDEGDRGSVALRHIEVGIIRIFVVMIFVLIPNGDEFRVDTVAYEEQSCAADSMIGSLQAATTSIPIPASVGIVALPVTYSAAGEIITGAAPVNTGLALSISGTQPRAPLLLEFVHNATSQTVNSIIKTIPCEADISGVAMSIGGLKHKTKEMADFLGDVVNQCYLPSVNDLLASNTITVQEVNDDYWIGSPLLLNGEYTERRMSLEPTYWARVIQSLTTLSWTMDPNADMNIVDDGRAGPLCSVGYDILSRFVKRDFEDEINDLDNSFLDSSWQSLQVLYSEWFGSGTSPTRGEDTIIKRLTSANTSIHADQFKTQNTMVQDSSQNSLVNAVTGFAKTVGLSFSAVGGLIEASFQKSLAYPLVAIVQCFLIAMTPVLLLLTGYKIKTVGMVVITMFGLEWVHLIFEMCAWMEHTLIALTTSSYNVMRADHTEAIAAIYNAVNIAYMLLPAIWFSLLAQVGGGLSNFGMQMSAAAKQTSQAAIKGAKMAKQIATKKK